MKELSINFTDHPDYLKPLLEEVDESASRFGVDIIFLLLDKLESDMLRTFELDSSNVESLLTYYKSLKISLYYLHKNFNQLNNEELSIKINNLTDKTNEARRKYYVAKRRIEEEHRDDCDCRGCRCIGQLGTNCSS